MTESWLVLYDADCGFCQWLLAGLLRWDQAHRLTPLALQRSEAAELLGDLTPTERIVSWHLISPRGERWSAGAAIPPLLRLLPGGGIPAAAFAAHPGPTERGYRWIASHRAQLSRLVPTEAKRQARRHVRERERAAGEVRDQRTGRSIKDPMA